MRRALGDRGIGRIIGDVAARVTETREAVTETLAADTMNRTVRTAAAQVTFDVVKGLRASPEFVAGVRQLVREAALDIARAILAEQLEDLEARVREQLTREFDERVSAAARELLDAKLADVRRRLGGL